MKIISAECAVAIRHEKRDLVWKGIFATLLASGFIYFMVTAHEIHYFHFYYACYLWYQMLLIYIWIQVYKIYKDKNEVIWMGFKARELKDINTEFNSVDEMIRHYQYHEVAWSRVFYVRVKLFFHIYCCETFYFLEVPCLTGILLISVYLDHSDQTFVQVYLVLLTLLRFFDILKLFTGIIFEWPRRIKRRWLRRRQRLELEADLLDLECQICLESLYAVADPRPITKLQCHPKHQFHQECLQQLRERGPQFLCPLCRAPIINFPANERQP